MRHLHKFMLLLVLDVALIAGGIAVYKHYQYQKPIVQPKKCTNIYAPCFEISMPNNPSYEINGWQHYGDSNCVIFNSLPDNTIHGYCGIYKISKLKRHTVVN